MPERLVATLRELTVLVNGRPKAAPRPMDVALILQAVDPASKDALSLDSVSLRASAGQTFSGESLAPGSPAGLELWKGGVNTRGAAVVDLSFVVYYQVDLGPLVGSIINRLIDLATAKLPFLGDVVGQRLHVKIGDRIAEEYGRQSLLVAATTTPDGPHVVTVDLVAPETIRGYYMSDATGTSAPQPKSGVFVEEGQVVARAVLEISLEKKAARAKKPAPGKPATRKRRAAARKKG